MLRRHSTHRRSTRQLAVESLEDRKLLTCSVPDGIALDDGVLCIDGSPYADNVTVELEFHPTQIDDWAPTGGGASGSGTPDSGEGTWVVKARMDYTKIVDPDDIYQDPQEDLDKTVILEVPLDEVDSIYFNGGGGNASDTFHNNTDLPSEAWGGGGVDNFYGGGGSDSFHGGGGADNIFGYGGADYLYGGDGNDDLYGGDGNDYLYGGADYDDLLGGDGVDHLYGQDGPDTLNGGFDNDVDFLQAGDDSDYFTPEVHTFSIDGHGYMLNFDTFDDCAYGDSVTGYGGVGGTVAEAFCNGETLELTLLHLGPADKTTEQPNTGDGSEKLDISGRELSLTTEDGTYVVYEVTVIDAAPHPAVEKSANDTNSSRDKTDSGDVDRIYAKRSADWSRLDIESVLDDLAADLARRTA